MDKTAYQETAMDYARDYLDRLLKIETIVENKLERNRKAGGKK